MNKAESSLLLYLESRAVDNAGAVDLAHMNPYDVAIAERWSESGFIEWGRIRFHNITRHTGTHWVRLSGPAWIEAEAERKARAERTWDHRSWKTTCEIGKGKA